MGKEQLNIGHKRGSRRVANSHTSPKVIRLTEKRRAALDYRLQGHPYWKIGKSLHCHPSTAQSYVIHAMKDMLPVEKRQEILQMEMQRLDMMQAAVYRDAENGDIPAQEAVLPAARMPKTLEFRWCFRPRIECESWLRNTIGRPRSPR